MHFYNMLLDTRPQRAEQSHLAIRFCYYADMLHTPVYYIPIHLHSTSRVHIQVHGFITSTSVGMILRGHFDSALIPQSTKKGNASTRTHRFVVDRGIVDGVLEYFFYILLVDKVPPSRPIQTLVDVCYRNISAKIGITSHDMTSYYLKRKKYCCFSNCAKHELPNLFPISTPQPLHYPQLAYL